MNIIETAKDILHGDADIDPMVVVRAVARLEPVACVNADLLRSFSANDVPTSLQMWKTRITDDGDVYLYTLEADK